MRRLITRAPNTIPWRPARQAGLLVALALGLAGFFLLLNLLVPLVSTGPQDIWAVNPSDEDDIRLPTGVAVMAIGVVAVSIILGLAALLVTQGWPRQRGGIRLSPGLVVGIPLSLALIGTGVYLAFSGVLGQDVRYEQHVASRSLLQPVGLAVLAGFLLSITMVGILAPRLLIPLLAMWLVLGVVFGLLNTQPLDGLQLFERPQRIQEPEGYSDIVERYLRVNLAEAAGTEPPVTPGIKTIEIPVLPKPVKPAEPGPDISLSTTPTPLQVPETPSVPLFYVTGSVHTRYLRTATGDVYEDGQWRQLESRIIDVKPATEIPNAVATLVETLTGQPSAEIASQTVADTTTANNLILLAPPTVEPVRVDVDRATITPAGEFGGFDAGTLPVSKDLESISLDATYNPFSATLSVSEPVRSYEWRSTVSLFPLTAMAEAAAAGDATYLQLPEEIPRRVSELAEEVAGTRSPYFKARAIRAYLLENYNYGYERGSGVVEPPVGQDPVDWFLFDHKQGGSGNFSTAFVVLARAVGVPARIVSGWALERTWGIQIVHSDQAHQWAEIALDGIGWITFDVTPRNGRQLPGPSVLGADGTSESEKLTPEEEVEVAVKTLTTSDAPESREEAARTLGGAASPEAAAALAEALASDPDISVQLAALGALETLDLELLIWVLQNHPQPSIRSAAANALGILGDLRALEALFSALATDTAAEVRLAAARALALLGDASAAEPLLRALEAEGDSLVREAIANALGVLKVPWTAQSLTGPLFTDPDLKVRSAIAKALGEIKEEAGLAPLLEASKVDDSLTVRASAERALTKWSGADLIRILEESEDAATRAAAAELLGNLGYQRAIYPLARATRDRVGIVREAAVEALAKYGTILPLENGGALLFRGLRADIAFIPGVTALASSEQAIRSAFRVTGAAGSHLLRTAVGDHYEDGRWLAYESIRRFQRTGESGVVHAGSLSVPSDSARESGVVQISVSHPVPQRYLLPGIVPTSPHMGTISREGEFWPESAVFAIDASTNTYDWASWVNDYSIDELRHRPIVPSDVHIALPQDIPQRVCELASEITDGQASPYEKALELEGYLKSNYAYAYAQSQEDASPPEGQDPVDWFLFVEEEGTSGNFSSAFAVLARCVGIPARVVSGWAIAPIPDSQTVDSNQAHQWAEVPFQAAGWVTFDPTPGGAPSRTPALLDSSNPDIRMAVIRRLLEDLKSGDSAARATAREILANTLASISEKQPALLQEVSDLIDSASGAQAEGAVSSHEAQALTRLNRTLAALPGQVSTALDLLEELGKLGLSELEPEANEEMMSSLAKLIESLSSSNATGRSRGLEATGELLHLLAEGGVVLRLENGGLLISDGGEGGEGSDSGQVEQWSFGTTAMQATKPPHLPVFEVRGAANQSYLRTAVGDIYEGGRWAQHDPVSFPLTTERSRYDVLIDFHNDADARETIAGTYEVSLLFGPQTPALRSERHLVEVLPANGASQLPPGQVITSRTLQTIDPPAIFHPYSNTFSSDTRIELYSWTSALSIYSEDQLEQGRVVRGLANMALPTDMPIRVAQLASEITSSHATDYAKAKALERYLKTEYTYNFASTTDGGRPPEGRDPVDWFLFESREGTCGTFSSAFAVLARATGLPARVVSGWIIAPTANTQTVYTDQAHQWAEVAFQGLGWVRFDPTPGGAPSRLSSSADSDSESLGDLTEALSSGDSKEREEALQQLEGRGADVARLENGGALVGGENGPIEHLSGGTTTEQASRPAPIPVFDVTGASHTGYLRMLTGDVYEGGGWRELRPLHIFHQGTGNLPDAVRATGLRSLPHARRHFELVTGFQSRPAVEHIDQIDVTPSGSATRLPPGNVPTSVTIQEIDRNGVFYPYSATYSALESVGTYSWVSKVPAYSEAQLDAASVVQDSTYTQLPPNLPSRIRNLARRITSRHTTPYAKAEAIRKYLQTQYPYRFADYPGQGSPPPGRDPVDWFLFDLQEGTCGVFSSAFVVLARSVGIPARVVSGFAIAATSQTQTVYADQGHQWAEVAFEGLGWVSFEPTPGGPPLRVSEPAEEPRPLAPTGPVDTVTEITEWPAQIRRETVFFVGGTVQTSFGHPVGGVTVEVYVNETKEHGGTKIGTTQAQRGAFRAEVRIPRDLHLGAYQLLARAVPNDSFNESWSDPDISVFSSSGLELRGPSEVPVDVEAAFRGKLADDTGTGVANRQVNVTVDGSPSSPLITDASGQFTFHESFADPGAHWVAVEVHGQEYLLDNTVRLDLMVTLPTELSLVVPPQVEVGREFSITGVLQDIRGNSLADRNVSVTVGSRPEQTAVTDSSGTFAIDGWAETAGDISVRAEFNAEGPTLASRTTTHTTAVHTVSLTLEGPSQIEQGSGASFTGILSSKTLSPLAQLQVSIEDGEGNELGPVVTAEDGSFEYHHPSFEVAGPDSLVARFLDHEFIASRSASVAFGVMAPTTLTIEGPAVEKDGQSPESSGVLYRGNEAVFTGSLSSTTLSPIGQQQLSIEDGEGQELAGVTTSADGTFEYTHSSLEDTGPHSLTVRFLGTESLAPGSSRVTFQVLAPTTLTIDGPTVVRSGEPFTFTGVLLRDDGVPVSDADVFVASGNESPLVTDSEGGFRWESVVPTDSASTDGAVESEFEAEVVFEGTEHLVPAAATATVFVGIPRIIIEPIETTARGDSALLRGTVLLGSHPIPHALVSIDGSIDIRTNEAGGFSYNYFVDEDTSLGINTVVIASEDIEASASASFQVKTISRLTVAPVDEVRPGKVAVLQAVLLDDKGSAIPQAILRVSGEEVVTEADGTALIELSVPDSHDLLSMPVTFEYEGDDFNMPLTYSLAVPITPVSYGWLLWAGLPTAVVLVIVAGFAGRKVGAVHLPSLKRSIRTHDHTEPDPVPVEHVQEAQEEEAPAGPQPARMEVRFINPAPDLADVWTIGEEVEIEIALTDNEEHGIDGGSVHVSLPGEGVAAELVTDDTGTCALVWTATDLGDYMVSAAFDGDDERLGVSESRTLRIVDFREEIVHLYNDFLDWAGERATAVSDQSTPREVELALVESGIRLDQRALDEIISRFEEADYSEHPIARRHYERMYRAWRAIVRG